MEKLPFSIILYTANEVFKTNAILIITTHTSTI